MQSKSIEGMLYSALSECYKEPTLKFAEDVINRNLYNTIENGFRLLEIPLLPETLKGIENGYSSRGEEGIIEEYCNLKEDYYSLFFPLYVVPVESVYKEWVDGKNMKGYIMGEPAIEMKKRFNMLEIDLPEIYKDTPDHISLLLEYASLLSEYLPREGRIDFVLNHLDWLDDMRNDVFKYTDSSFYRSVADITVAFCEYESSNLLMLRR